MSSEFSELILADKLSKLNTTQQCIQSLSQWCIFNRSKADLVVAVWVKQFRMAQLSQKVPLLFLANDVLQNSKKNGNEFVNEFWKVLPTALKEVIAEGDKHGKKTVSRLISIWEERRVFGYCKQGLMDALLGGEVPQPLDLSNKRDPGSVRIMKRDSRSIRTKLSIGGPAEKIVSAFHLVLAEQPNEDAEMNNCSTAVLRVKEIQKDLEAATSANVSNREALADVLEGEVKVMRQSVEKLRVVEANRVALVAHLREVLHEQESQLENIRTQMQVARAQADASARRPTDAECGNQKKTAAEVAAEVADRLAASSSSQLIMSSVLSTFAAEEAKSALLFASPPPAGYPAATFPLPRPPQYVQMLGPYSYGNVPSTPPPPLPPRGTPLAHMPRMVVPPPPPPLPPHSQPSNLRPLSSYYGLPPR